MLIRIIILLVVGITSAISVLAAGEPVAPSASLKAKTETAAKVVEAKAEAPKAAAKTEAVNTNCPNLSGNFVPADSDRELRVTQKACESIRFEELSNGKVRSVSNYNLAGNGQVSKKDAFGFSILSARVDAGKILAEVVVMDLEGKVLQTSNLTWTRTTDGLTSEAKILKNAEVIAESTTLYKAK